MGVKEYCTLIISENPRGCHGGTGSHIDSGLLTLFLQDGPIYGAIHGEYVFSTPGKSHKPGAVDWHSDQPNWKLSSKRLGEWWRDPHYCVGKRFNSKTSYLMMDLDRGSPYHPANDIGAYRRLLTTLKAIGLCRPVVVTSSDSKGLHLYFPLGEQVPSFKSAQRLQRHLEAHGFPLKGGHLETFPNAKASKDAQYNGHRLPLQRGSLLVRDNLSPRGNDPQMFVEAWAIAAAGNCFQLTPAPAQPLPTAPAAPQLPPIGWTDYGQSNDVLRRLANWGYKHGHQTVSGLSAWMRETAPRLPGYAAYASPDAKADIEQGNWSDRWAKWKIRKGGGAAPAPNHAHNATVACEAMARLTGALAAIRDRTWETVRSLYQAVRDWIAAHHGVGISLSTFYRHRPLWQSLLTTSGGHLGSVSPLPFSLAGEEGLDQPIEALHPVNNGNGCVTPDVVEVEGVTHPPQDAIEPPPPSPRGIGRVKAAQLPNLPNPEAILATGAELEQAGIRGYGHHHTWTIRRGEYSPDLWNRLRAIAFGSAQHDPPVIFGRSPGDLPKIGPQV